jgi:protein-disulfide isomerase
MSRLPLRCFALLGLLATVLAALPALLAQAPNQPLTHEKIIRFVRERFTIPESVKITITDLRESAYPDYLETTVTVDDGKEKHSQPLFISRNMRYLVAGSMFNLGGDSRQDIVRLISLPDQATQGPADAPVTLVEYSDLQCPVCAHFHEELETEVVPKYGDKLRVVFKEFPLVSMHDWALTGAIAAECTYQIDPSKYVAFRSAVFKNQVSMSAEHARDMLLHFGAEAGVDNMKLAACIDSQGSLSRVEANIHEGEALGVGQTPTSYVNGRYLVGAPPATDIYKLIDEAMRDPK